MSLMTDCCIFVGAYFVILVAFDLGVSGRNFASTCNACFTFNLDVHMSRPMGKPTICIDENKGTDQRLCFRYSDSTIRPLLNSKISSF